MAERHQTGFVQEVPSPKGSAKLIGSDAIKEIVSGNHDEGDASYGPARQPDQPRECHHRGSDHEDDACAQAVGIEFEAPAEFDECEIDQDQPQPAD